MESMISELVARFENGQLSRRAFVGTLAALASGGTAAAAPAAPAELDFKTAIIDHMSIQVANMQRSAEFYQKMFGFKVISEDKLRGIVRLGNERTLVSFNTQPPVGIVDHFAIGVENFNKDEATRVLKAYGLTPIDDLDAGFHVKDPEGINVQIV